MKALYKTVWEYKQRDLVDMAADRGAFIDQSQVRFTSVLCFPASLPNSSMFLIEDSCFPRHVT